jgi:hypothetical protein
MRGSDGDDVAFWRDRAVRMRAIAGGTRAATDVGGSGDAAADGGGGRELGLVATLQRDVAQERRLRARATTSWAPRAYPLHAYGGDGGGGAAGGGANEYATKRDVANEVMKALEEAKARRARPTTKTPETALDGATTVDGLREGYKRLLREVTARHARTREALEKEIATLRARVEALETSASTSRTTTSMTTPKREMLIATADDDDDDDVACDLSPFSASERTPPLSLRAGEDESADDEANVETPRAFRPPRPPRNGDEAENDMAFVNIGPPPLPAVRPGQGYVCPFSGEVLLKTP